MTLFAWHRASGRIVHRPTIERYAVSMMEEGDEGDEYEFIANVGTNLIAGLRGLIDGEAMCEILDAVLVGLDDPNISDEDHNHKLDMAAMVLGWIAMSADLLFTATDLMQGFANHPSVRGVPGAVRPPDTQEKFIAQAIDEIAQWRVDVLSRGILESNGIVDVPTPDNTTREGTNQ